MSTLREKWHAGLNVWRTSGGLSAPSALLRFYRCATRCDAATTRAYLEGLVRNGLQITVFATGSFIEKNTGWALRMQGLGCEIGLHGYHHLSPNRMTPARFETDLQRCIAAFRRAGISFSGYRAPNLAMAPGCYPVLRRLGIAYSSSLLCSLSPLPPVVKKKPRLPLRPPRLLLRLLPLPLRPLHLLLPRPLRLPRLLLRLRLPSNRVTRTWNRFGGYKKPAFGPVFLWLL